MTNKTEKQIAELKLQRFGVEIETAGISREKAARKIAEYFGTENTVKHTGGGYDTWVCKDTKGRTWKAMSDSSIRAINGKAAEIVTPILTYDDMEDLQEIARRIRRAGGISTPERGASVHIHIDGQGHDARTLRNLVNIMASHEHLLIKALNIDAYRLRHYCRTVNPAFLANLNYRKPKTMKELADLWYAGTDESRTAHYNSTRYSMANLHSVFSHGTIELRFFQFDNPHDGKKGGINALQLKAFIQLSLALCHMAKMVKTASPKPQQTENPRYALRTWLLRLGFIGEEFATARKVYTERLEGNAAFRRGRVA